MTEPLDNLSLNSLLTNLPSQTVESNLSEKMSTPIQLVAQGCTVDLSLNARKQLPLLAISTPLHIVPSPPSTCPPPSYASSRHLPRHRARSPGDHPDRQLHARPPCVKAASHPILRKQHSYASTSSTHSPDYVLKESISQPISRETTKEECEEGVLVADPNDLNISKEGRKGRRRRKNSHRKSKSKHRLKSARGVKALKDSETAVISPSPDHSSPIQVVTAPIKMSAAQKTNKSKVDYVHTRARSQPEKVYRKSVSAEQIILSASTEALGHIKSLKASTESLNHGRPLRTPYGILPSKQSKEQDVVKRLTKVYLSEKQSKNTKELGMEIPMAPPATPLPDPGSGRVVEYVASLSDVRSQREVRARLAVLERAAREQAEQRRDEHQRQEKAALAELRREKRRIQRRQVGGGAGGRGEGGGREEVDSDAREENWWDEIESAPGHQRSGDANWENVDLFTWNPGNQTLGNGNHGQGIFRNENPWKKNPVNGNLQSRNPNDEDINIWNPGDGDSKQGNHETRNRATFDWLKHNVVYVDGDRLERTRNRNPENVKPKNGNPENVKPQTRNPKNIKPKIGNPENVKPITGNPENMKPNNGNSENVKPKTGNPENMKPKNGNPENVKLKTRNPKNVKPKTENPENAKLKTRNPENVKPKNGNPENVKPKHGNLRPTFHEAKTDRTDETKFTNAWSKSELKHGSEKMGNKENGSVNYQMKTWTKQGNQWTKIEKEEAKSAIDKTVNGSDWIKDGFMMAKYERDRNEYLNKYFNNGTKSLDEMVKLSKIKVVKGNDGKLYRTGGTKNETNETKHGTKNRISEAKFGTKNRTNGTKNKNEETKHESIGTRNRTENKNVGTEYRTENKSEYRTENKSENRTENKNVGTENRTENKNVGTENRTENKSENRTENKNVWTENRTENKKIGTECKTRQIENRAETRTKMYESKCRRHELRSRNSKEKNPVVVDRTTYKMFGEMKTKYWDGGSIDMKPAQQNPVKKIKYIDAPIEEKQDSGMIAQNGQKEEAANRMEKENGGGMKKEPMKDQNQNVKSTKTVEFQPASVEQKADTKDRQSELQTIEDEYISPIVLESFENLICVPPKDWGHWDTENKNSSNKKVDNSIRPSSKQPHKVNARTVKSQLEEMISEEKRQERERQRRSIRCSAEFLMRRLQEAIEEANKRYGRMPKEEMEVLDISFDFEYTYGKPSGLTGKAMQIREIKQEDLIKKKEDVVVKDEKSKEHQKKVGCKTPRKGQSNRQKINRKKSKKSPRNCKKVLCKSSTDKITSKSLLNGYRISSQSPVPNETFICKSPVAGEKAKCKSPIDGDKAKCKSPVVVESPKSLSPMIGDKTVPKSPVNDDGVMCEKAAAVDKVMCKSPPLDEKVTCRTLVNNGKVPVTCKSAVNSEKNVRKNPVNSEEIACKTLLNNEKVPVCKSPANSAKVTFKSPIIEGKTRGKASLKTNKTSCKTPAENKRNCKSPNNKNPSKDDRVLCKSPITGEKLMSVADSHKKASILKSRAGGVGTKKKEETKERNVGPSPDLLQRLPYRKPKGIEAQAVADFQRKQIYALNAVMTQFENKNFKEFCKKNGISKTS